MRLSSVVLTHNSETSLVQLLSALTFSDEIIVVDDYSEDKTKDIALTHTKKVFQNHLNEDSSQQRNFGLSKAEGDWIFFIDSDELPSERLIQELQSLKKTDPDPISAYRISRKDFFWDREIRFGEISEVRDKGLIRLVKKNSGLWKGRVHETFHTTHRIGKLKGFIEHRPHESIISFLRKINFYSTIRAKELSGTRKFSLTELIFILLIKFFYTYVLKFGFLDGARGFIYSFMLSFHSYLVRAKLLNV